MLPIAVDFSPQSWDDPDTGRKVTRLFPIGQPGSHAYFTSTSFDSRGHLILSAVCDNRWQLLRIDTQARRAWQLTDFADMQGQRYCVSPSADCALVINGDSLVRVQLQSGEATVVFAAPAGWRISLPTVDSAGTRVAFAISEIPPGFTVTQRIYSGMPENFFFRPRSMICCLELADNSVSVAWGETEWISHVLINPADPDTIVFCHEGGSLAQHRLWAVDAGRTRKKQSRCLYLELSEEFMVHEYFLKDGTLGVQRSWYEAGTPLDYTGPYPHSSIMFLDMAGQTVAEYVLPGLRSGHVQSNSDNSLIVADCCYTGDPDEGRDGRRCMALNIPDGNVAHVEKLCRHDSSWRTQISHPHPIFSPDDRHVVFSSDAGGTNSAFVVEVY